MIYKRFFKEKIKINFSGNRTTIIPKDEMLYHGTGASFDVRKIGTSGYDKILWTTDNIKIARYYIPIAGTKHSSLNLSDLVKSVSMIREKQKIPKWFYGIGLTDTLIQNLLKKGWENQQKTFGLKDKKLKLSKEIVNLYDSIDYDMPDEDAEKIMGQAKNLEDELDILEDYIKKNPVRNEKFLLLKKIQQILEKQYDYHFIERNEEIIMKEHNFFLSSGETEVLSANYRAIGKVIILQPKRNLKMYTYAKGEGDLNNPQYHNLSFFRNIEEKGYDGIVIDDFAQSEYWGNIDHIAYGLFKNTIKDCKISSLKNQKHPED